MAGRSYLFVPGDRPDRFAKAHTAGADAVIIDLEDSVSGDNKAAEGATLGAFRLAGEMIDRPVIERAKAILGRSGRKYCGKGQR
jgi:citrate lyase subunit beta/citryl-CoA lyase